MNALIEFLNSSWLHALGYTLLHSLWQGAIVITCVTLILQFTSVKLSNAHYCIASVGLLVIFIFSAGTFFYIYSRSTPLPSTPELLGSEYLQKTTQPEKLSVLSDYLNTSRSFIRSTLPFFLMVWFCGTLIFSLRILTGLMYVGKLREEAVLISSEWSQHIQRLAQQLQIKRWVLLAESHDIQAPIVIGFLKPMILVPMAMLTTLSSEQLETIFLHELMHIRRKDYLINLIQSFLEAIFFFNPFVWIISGIMKKEREHCCDDAVVLLHGNPIAYAQALTSLEEVRLSKAGLSISLAENKNQLLNRIKRLMEKSVKNYSGRERMIPALLLVLGLICASWISTQTGRKEIGFNQTKKENIPSDTIKKAKKNKQAKKETKAIKKITTINEAEKSDHEIAQSSDVDVDVWVVPPVPPIDVDLDVVPNIDVMIPPIPDFNFMFDNFNKTEQELEAFSKEFEEKFRLKFGDFYETHGKDIEQMIQEVQQNVYSKLDKHDELNKDWELKMHKDFAINQEERAKIQAEKWEQHVDELSRQKERIENSAKDRKIMAERQSMHLQEFEKNQKQFEKKMKLFEDNMKRFEEDLKNELIKDGYLDKDEKLNNMHWNNGSIEINGKKIKPSDEEKYNELHKKYFKEKKELDSVE